MIGTLTLTHNTTTFLPVRKLSNVRKSICRASVQTASPPSYTCKPADSLYEVLRVGRNASSVEIKAAYRNLAKVYHPDSSVSDSSDGRDFIEIREAYSTLSDPSTRAIYDMTMGIGFGMRPIRYGNDVSGYYRTRRWETDQCW